jgi:signal transduction histidine kinase
MLVVLTALAVGTLWAAGKVHTGFVHADATLSVIRQAQQVVRSVLRELPRDWSHAEGELWPQMTRLVEFHHGAEPGLQAVTIRTNQVTVFQVQTAGLRGEDSAPERERQDPATNVFRISRRVLDLGAAEVPVVVCAATFVSPDGTHGDVEAAVRLATVGREERAAAGAIRAMLGLSLATAAAALSLSGLLLVWVLRREAVLQTQRRAEEHLAFSGVMANGIAHDFRNPMSSLRLDVQMLQREAGRAEPAAARIGALAERVRHTLDRMDTVFRQFLFLSRPSAGELERVDLVECVHESATMLTPRFEDAGVTLRTESDAAHVPVQAHAAALRRSLVNLLVNAVEFAGSGKTVHVRSYVRGDRGVVDVTDDGPGVPRAHRRRIFEMFFTTRPGGTGLGLFLARAAVERCGGSLTLEESERGGARFRISLPLARAEQEGGLA